VEPSDWEPGHSGGGDSYRPSPHGKNSYQEEAPRRPIGPNAPGIPVQRTTNGFAAFERDVFEFETTGLVPISWHIVHYGITILFSSLKA